MEACGDEDEHALHVGDHSMHQEEQRGCFLFLRSSGRPIRTGRTRKNVLQRFGESLLSVSRRTISGSCSPASACDVVQLRSEAQFKELIGFIVADVMSEGSRRSVVHDHNNNRSNHGRHCNNNNNGEITATMEDMTAIITTTLN